VAASVGGRGALARVRRATLLLPGPDGAVAPLDPVVARPRPAPAGDTAVAAAVAAAVADVAPALRQVG
jgi:hypothetical protein